MYKYFHTTEVGVSGGGRIFPFVKEQKPQISVLTHPMSLMHKVENIFGVYKSLYLYYVTNLKELKHLRIRYVIC